ncbi:MULTISPECIES: hypothetical protein [unclassified Moorena]|uniref:hypothetical protein n=1 Tax=unclassified Moorena TaxID=2683338 RepID=UPI0013C64577|nr:MULTISPECIES: hypothetical protein [unclassified Moorena]NEO23333.1 hypothetical protein [Moorena sp. SIO4A5]NEQ59491.1 hypothetical protein [Moorena sp. SIO4A1]
MYGGLHNYQVYRIVFLLPTSDFPLTCSRLDAVAHGGNPQDRAASLLPAPCSLKTQNFVPN